ncbi:MAG: MBL fold metallo-hydrolase [Candidatus Thorarchaeota archaeon]|nr:MBL fold metallo-hydrolase [Candidatus Thorarchaeota archaeon]
MRIIPVRSQGLAHLSYVVASNGEAMVVDPRRDIDIYLDLSRDESVDIVKVFETHRNEDYVIGSLEIQYHLPKLEIVHSSATNFRYGTHSVSDGDTFMVGQVEVSCITTPGHTDDSMCYVIADRSVSKNPLAVFTGDTLFVNEVGRTDLVDKNKHKEMSRKLYESLHEKILPLGDGVIVYPGHGAGSVCGGDIGEREFTTIGYERMNNTWLSYDLDDFVEKKIRQKLTLSSYFKHCEKLNTIGPPILAEMSSPRQLDPDRVDYLLKQNDHVAVDVRSADFFVSGHIPGSISIPLNGMGMIAGWVLKPDEAVILVIERLPDLKQAIAYLHRIGYDRILGYLGPGLDAWYESGRMRATLRNYCVEDLKAMYDSKLVNLIDVRQVHETEKEYIQDSIICPLTDLPNALPSLDMSKPAVTICPSGNRSTSAASILQRSGLADVGVVLDGLNGWKQRGYETVPRH